MENNNLGQVKISNEVIVTIAGLAALEVENVETITTITDKLLKNNGVKIQIDEEQIILDIYVNMPITFSQAALGASIVVPTVYGDFSLKIPAGTQSGTKFKLAGKGIKDGRSSATGNQFVIVKVITPSKLSQEQKELFTKLANTDEKSESAWDKIKKFFKGQSK